MSDDINVKEIALLKTYISKLQEVRDIQIARSLLIERHVCKELSIISDRLSSLNNLAGQGNEHERSMFSRYQNATTKLSDNQSLRNVIGHSDFDMQKLNREFQDKISNIRRLTEQYILKLEETRQKTKTFSLESMTNIESSLDYIGKVTENLEGIKQI